MIGSFYMVLAIIFFALSLVNITQFAKKLNAMHSWIDFAPCIDSYMQITEFQISETEKASELAAFVLAMACIIFVIGSINLVGNIFFLCKTCK